MQLLSIKAVITVLWVSTMAVVGIAAHPLSYTGWTVLAAMATIPPFVMMWQWHHPRPTMSESIREALR